MRRRLLKGIGGSAIAATTFSGNAIGQGDSKNASDGLGIKIEKRSSQVQPNQMSGLWSEGPVKEMRKFLRKERDVKITPTDLVEYEVEMIDKGESFRLFRTKFTEENQAEADFLVRVQGDVIYTSSTVGTDVYKSSTSIIDDRQIQSSKPELEEYDIISGKEWSSRQKSKTGKKDKGVKEIAAQSANTEVSCDFAYAHFIGTDLYPPQWMCEAVFVLGSITLILTPEPATTAAGATALATATFATAASGGCYLTYVIEDGADIDMGVSAVLCMNTECTIDGFDTGCGYDFDLYLEQDIGQRSETGPNTYSFRHSFSTMFDSIKNARIVMGIGLTIFIFSKYLYADVTGFETVPSELLSAIGVLIVLAGVGILVYNR